MGRGRSPDRTTGRTSVWRRGQWDGPASAAAATVAAVEWATAGSGGAAVAFGWDSGWADAAAEAALREKKS